MPHRDGIWQAPELAVAAESIDGETRLLRPTGELDVSTAPALDDAFRQQAGDGDAPRLVLDLTGVSFLDSTAMALIAGWRDRLVDAGGRFALVTADPQQQRLFHLTALTDRLRVSATREQALEALDAA